MKPYFRALLCGLAIGFPSAALAQYTFITSNFSPGALPLLDQSAAVNGSWHGDIYQSAARFQEVGGLGLATDSGIAYSQVFSPIDLTGGFGGFGLFDVTVQVPNPYYDPSRPVGPFNQPLVSSTATLPVHLAVDFELGVGQPNQPLRLTLYDTSGGSSHWDLSPTSAVGVFAHNNADESSFTGNLDWTHVDQFSVSGQGGDQPFHAAFDYLSITQTPEPGAVAPLAAAALLAFAAWRKIQPAPTKKPCH